VKNRCLVRVAAAWSVLHRKEKAVGFGAGEGSTRFNHYLLNKGQTDPSSDCP